MFNFLDVVKANPAYYKQLSVDSELVTEYNCPLKDKKVDIWTEQGYFVYVTEGRKTWHVPGHSFEMTAGQCIFVKKGAQLVEQFFETPFCLIIFFVSDSFIVQTLQSLPGKMMRAPGAEDAPIFRIDADETLHAFFHSVVPYFLHGRETSKVLLSLKFTELILNVAGNPRNAGLTNYFYSLVKDPAPDNLRKVMEQNFLSKLSVTDFARLCGRSLSAFKRDFEEQFQAPPGRWLLSRRLQHARLLLDTTSRPVSDIAFECGFENVSHFSRSFSQEFGDSPARLRRVAGL